MPVTLADLLAGLDLAPDRLDRYLRRTLDEGRRRIFGGLVGAQASVAAAHTAGGRPVHALHGAFVLPGDIGALIAYVVECLRDGGSFSIRRCVASHHGRVLFALSASFHEPEPGALDHAAPMPVASPPDASPAPGGQRATRRGDTPAGVPDRVGRDGAVETRPADAAVGEPAPEPQLRHRASWMRTVGRLPDEPAIHAAVLAYMSDLTLLDASLRAHGRSVFDPDIQAASLDHAVWPYRPARRRLAPLRGGRPWRIGRARLLPRLGVRPHRRARRLEGAGGPHPPAPGSGRIGQSLAIY